MIRECQVPLKEIKESYLLRAEALQARLQDCLEAGIDVGLGDYVELKCGSSWRIALVVDRT